MSGKQLPKKKSKSRSVQAKVSPAPLAAGVAASTRKLDLACGGTPMAGFEGVDIWAGPSVTHVVNLMRYPWPFEDESVDEIHCSHFVEHLPDTFVMPDGSPVHPGEPHFDHNVAKDAWFKFFEEIWRILKPGAIATILCPSARNHRAFQDPTHRRFIVGETFGYLAADWRKAVGLGHYNTHVNFSSRVDFGTMAEFNAKHEQVRQHAIQHDWNVIFDYQAILQKQPRMDLPAATPAGGGA